MVVIEIWTHCAIKAKKKAKKLVILKTFKFLNSCSQKACDIVLTYLGQFYVTDLTIQRNLLYFAVNSYLLTSYFTKRLTRILAQYHQVLFPQQLKNFAYLFDLLIFLLLQRKLHQNITFGRMWITDVWNLWKVMVICF